MLSGLGRGMNPHKMKRMMKQMGINVEEINDIEQIIIRTSDKKYIFEDDVSCTIMNAQGQKTFQIVGNPKIVERDAQEIEEESDETIEEETEESTISIPDEDIKLVCGQTGVSEEEARAALEASDGNPAEAILKLMEQ